MTGWLWLLLLTLAGGLVLYAVLAVLAVILVARRVAIESLERE
jgi:hypothetical protein